MKEAMTDVMTIREQITHTITVDGTGDPEINTILLCLRAIRDLQPDAKARVVAYLAACVKDGDPRQNP